MQQVTDKVIAISANTERQAIASGTMRESMEQVSEMAMQLGIAKINVGTEIRQPYEAAVRAGKETRAAQDAVYERTRWVLEAFLEVAGKRKRLVEG